MQTEEPMSQESKFRKALSRWGLGTLALVLLAFGIWFLLPSQPPRTNLLRLSAGSAAGLRHKLGERIAEHAEASDIHIVMQATKGSADAIDALIDGKLDLALVQGGLNVEQRDKLRQLAVLNFEPLHLLVSPKVPTSEDIFESLRGRRINVGQPGSGTNLLSREILRFANLETGADYEETNLSYEQLMAAESDELPEAVFTVSILPSPIARQLIRKQNYRLVPLPFSKPFRLGLEDAKETGGIVHRRIGGATIPAFAYQVNPAAPSEDIRTIGYRLQLVAKADLPDDYAERITKLVYESDLAGLADPPLRSEDLNPSREFKLHSGASDYLKRNAPIVSGQLVEFTEQVLAIIATAIGGLLFAWQWLRSTWRRNRDRDFLARIKRVVEIENHAADYESDKSMSVDDLIQLQNELRSMRSEMVEDFQAGRIESLQLFSQSLKHISDANEQVTRVILHERAPRDAVERDS